MHSCSMFKLRSLCLKEMVLNLVLCNFTPLNDFFGKANALVWKHTISPSSLLHFNKEKFLIYTLKWSILKDKGNRHIQTNSFALVRDKYLKLNYLHVLCTHISLKGATTLSMSKLSIMTLSIT
jgi:hypothetical protein